MHVQINLIDLDRIASLAISAGLVVFRASKVAYDQYMIEVGFKMFVVFALGAAIGSFLHVVAERYGTGQGILRSNSYCPHCKKRLTARQLVPIFSYIFSGAQCAMCKAEIPAHYPIIELLAGLFAVVLFAPNIVAAQLSVLPGLLFIAACILIILIRIDSRSMLLPDGYIYALTIIAGICAAYVHRDSTDIVFGVLAGAGALYLLWIGTGGRGIGFGDVKLMIPLGILFGLYGVIALLFFSFFAGGLVSMFLLAVNRVTPKTAIPFGPFLAGSALLLLAFPDAADRFFILLGVY